MANENCTKIFEILKYYEPDCGTEKWIEITDNVCGMDNTNSEIKFKTTMSKSSFCD